MHQHAEADRGIEGTIPECQLVRIPDTELHREVFAVCPLARDFEHLSRGIHAGHHRPAPGQQERRATRAGPDVEHARAREARQELDQDLLLRFGQQGADRTAETQLIEPAGVRRIGVHRVAVMVRRRRRGAGHRAPPATAGSRTSCIFDIASRVFSRYAA